MLVRPEGDATLLIGQASHAWLSGQLALAWGNDRFPPPHPRAEVWLAATQHDVGMAEWDLRPALHPETGLPRSFMEMPLETHLALWAAAPTKLLTQSVYAALLTSMHGVALYARRDLTQTPPAERRMIESYLDTQRTLQATLAAQLGADRDEVARNQRLIWAWDSLSLAVCLGWESLRLRDVPAVGEEQAIQVTATGPRRFTLHPWPFSPRTVEVRCEGRRLAGPFADDRQLHDALRVAPTEQLVMSLVPG